MKNEMLLLLGCWLRPAYSTGTQSHARGHRQHCDTDAHRRKWAKAAFKADYFSDTNILILYRCKGMLIMLLRRRSRPRDWARARDCSPVAQHKRHPTSPLPTSPLPTSAPLALPTPLQSRTHTAVRGAPTTTLRDAELISGHQGAAERRARANMTRSAHHDARERQGGAPNESDISAPKAGGVSPAQVHVLSGGVPG